jgi:hypothetical protein
MKRFFYFTAVLALVLAAASCGNQASKEVTQKIDAIEVSIDSLLNDASELDGQTVRFTASVDHACTHGGKRLTVFGTVEGKTLKIDAKEGSPKFASSLMGKTVEITGVVRRVAGTHVAGCDSAEGDEVPEVAYVVECISYSEL